LAVTLGGVGYLCFFKEWSAIIGAVRAAHLPWLAAAFVFYGITTGLGMLRWHLLLRSSEIPLSLPRTGQLTLIGLFANTFMPGGMGGDLFKAVLAAREVPDHRTTVVMSIVMERVLGFVAMFIVSTTLILSRIGPLTAEPVTRVAVILYFIVFALTLTALGLGAIPGSGRFIPFWQRLPVRETLADAGRAYQFFTGHRACFWGGLAFSILAHLSLLGSCFCVSLALGLGIDFWDLGAVMPLIALVTLAIPSIGGLGVRELAFQHFLTYVAITKETSIALSLVFFVVTLSWGALGGIAYVTRRSSHPQENAITDEDDPFNHRAP
jgi:uncharacterized membrane protein YbhN (UPF0104 family)